MSFSRITKIAAIGAFAVAIPLAIGAPAFATTPPDAHQTVAHHLTAHQPNKRIVFFRDGLGPTQIAAVDAAADGAKAALRDYETRTGAFCSSDIVGPITANQVGPQLWHATAQLTAECSA
ncbi:MAG: hypothetical protein JOZ47_14695 [Kutzneria sp.]|nr:hypothetical protein [Kutzneria sp.]